MVSNDTERTTEAILSVWTGYISNSLRFIENWEFCDVTCIWSTACSGASTLTVNLMDKTLLDCRLRRRRPASGSAGLQDTSTFSTVQPLLSMQSPCNCSNSFNFFMKSSLISSSFAWQSPVKKLSSSPTWTLGSLFSVKKIKQSFQHI